MHKTWNGTKNTQIVEQRTNNVNCLERVLLSSCPSSVVTSSQSNVRCCLYLFLYCRECRYGKSTLSNLTETIKLFCVSFVYSVSQLITMSSGASKKRHCAFCLGEMDAAEAKKCGGCKKRVYCSRECQTEDWSPKKGGQGHKNWCGLDCGEEDVDWKVTPVPGKGLGIVALRDLPSRFRIIVEASVDKSHPRVADLVPENGTLEEKLLLNTIFLGRGPEDGVAIGSVLCLRISRLNHSCNPNAGHYYEKNLKVLVLFAEREVKEGEEICISYVNVRSISAREIPEMGRLRLELVYGITCDSNCDCYDQQINRWVKYGRELDANILRLSCTTGNPEGAIIEARKLIELEEELKLSWINRQRTFYDAFQVAIMKRESIKEGLGYLAQAVAILSSIHHPQKTKEVQDLKIWLANPKTHFNYLKYDY